MRLSIALAALLMMAAPAMAQPAAFCPYGQPCQDNNPVPFPVINPVQGLNVLTQPMRSNPPPQPALRVTTPTPPPVMPPAP